MNKIIFPIVGVLVWLILSAGCSWQRNVPDKKEVPGTVLLDTGTKAAGFTLDGWKTGKSYSPQYPFLLQGETLTLREPSTVLAGRAKAGITAEIIPLEGETRLFLSKSPGSIFLKIQSFGKGKAFIFLCALKAGGEYDELYTLGIPADRPASVSLLQEGDVINTFVNGRLVIPYRKTGLPPADFPGIEVKGKAELYRLVLLEPESLHMDFTVPDVTVTEDLRKILPSVKQSAPSFPEGAVPATGYSLRSWIPPTGLGSPADIHMTSRGILISATIRGRGVVKIEEDGSVHPWCSKGINYALGELNDGRIIVYSQPAGATMVLSPEGKILKEGEESDLAAPYESPFAVLKDDRLFFAVNRQEGGSFYTSLPGGKPEKIGSYSGLIMALVTLDNGDLIAGDAGGIYRLDSETGDVLEILFTGRETGEQVCSFKGLARGRDGSLYGTNGESVWKRDPQGKITFLARGLSGLEGITVDGNGDIYTVSRGNGALYKITRRGVETIIPTNHLVTPQAIRFDNRGQAYISQDEAMRIGVFTPGGELSYEIRANAAQGPLADLLPYRGALLLSEAAPGNPSLLVRFKGGTETREIITDTLSAPAGLAEYNGDLFVADNGAKKIVRFTPEGLEKGRYTVFAELPEYPNFIDFDAAGNLYVCCGKDPGNINAFSNSVYMFSAGKARLLWQHPGITVIRTDTDGTLLVSTGLNGELHRLDTATGKTEVLLSGMREIAGIAVRENGDIYLCDDFLNAVYMLSRK